MSVKQYSSDITPPSTEKYAMKEPQLQTVVSETPSDIEGQVQTADATHLGAFGQAAQAGGKQYRVLGRWKTTFVLIHTEVGIGILSLPSVLMTLGLIPGLFAILLIGLLATYTAYLYLQYWRRYPHINNLADALKILGGKPAFIIGGIFLIINLSFACASAVLTMSIALNTLTGHSMCTAGFVAIASLVCYVLCMPRTMNFVSYFSRMFHSLSSSKPDTKLLQFLPHWALLCLYSSSLDPWCMESRRRHLKSGTNR